MKPGQFSVLALALCSCISLIGCAGGGGDAATRPTMSPPPTGNISVSVTPATAAVTISQTVQFSASVANTNNTAVNWMVNGVAGGNGSIGTISPAGLYTAPDTVPSSSISISATSVADTTKSGTGVVNVKGYTGMLLYHNDAGITGQNLNETVLTPTNVNQSLFGKVYSYSLDGQSFTQPLYVSKVPIPGQGTHNVVFVGTEHDTYTLLTRMVAAGRCGPLTSQIPRRQLPPFPQPTWVAEGPSRLRSVLREPR